MLWIFASMPEKVRILPALEMTFKMFLASVEGSELIATSIVMAKTNESSKKKERKAIAVATTADDLTTRMLEWCQNRGHDRLNKFKIEKTSFNAFIYTCQTHKSIIPNLVGWTGEKRKSKRYALTLLVSFLPLLPSLVFLIYPRIYPLQVLLLLLLTW